MKMNIWQSLFLGILQGIAEFLPISSSGHLAISKSLLGLQEVPLLFDVMLHVATLAAVCIYFRKQIIALFAAFFRWIGKKSKPEDAPLQKMILAVIFGTISTGVIAIILQKTLPDFSNKVICAGFLVTALLLVFSSFFAKHKEKNRLVGENGTLGEAHSSDETRTLGENGTVGEAHSSDEIRTLGENGTNVKNATVTISPLQGFLVGIAQGLGTLPGISRSGITISASQVTGIDRKTAGEFSFILSIPAILGAFILELKDLGDITESIGIIPLLIGLLVAFVSGLIALKFLMKLINKGKLEYFAFYLIPLGIFGLFYF